MASWRLKPSARRRQVERHISKDRGLKPKKAGVMAGVVARLPPAHLRHLTSAPPAARVPPSGAKIDILLVE